MLWQMRWREHFQFAPIFDQLIIEQCNQVLLLQLHLPSLLLLLLLLLASRPFLLLLCQQGPASSGIR